MTDGAWSCARCGAVSATSAESGGAYRDPRCGACGGVLMQPADEVVFDAPPGPTSALSCPGCGVALGGRAIGDEVVAACDLCHGMFVPAEVLKAWTRERASQAPADVATQVVLEERWEVRYRRCPCCAEIMNRANFAPGTGIILDVCSAHGCWLDAGELEGMLAYVREHGVEGTALHRAELRKKGRERLAELQFLVGDGRLTGVRSSAGYQAGALGKALLELLRGWWR